MYLVLSVFTRWLRQPSLDGQAFQSGLWVFSLLPNSKRFNGGGLECQKKVVFTYGRKGRLVNGMVSWLPGHIG